MRHINTCVSRLAFVGRYQSILSLRGADSHEREPTSAQRPEALPAMSESHTRALRPTKMERLDNICEVDMWKYPRLYEGEIVGCR